MDRVKIDNGLLNEMATALEQSAQILSNATEEIRVVEIELSDPCMNEAFNLTQSTVLGNELIKDMVSLHEKLLEMQVDIRVSLEAFMSADAQSRSFF